MKKYKATAILDDDTLSFFVYEDCVQNAYSEAFDKAVESFICLYNTPQKQKAVRTDVVIQIEET